MIIYVEFCGYFQSHLCLSTEKLPYLRNREVCSWKNQFHNAKYVIFFKLEVFMFLFHIVPSISNFILSKEEKKKKGLMGFDVI